MEPGFEETLSDFCRQHTCSFEDSEENKLEHMDIFRQYVDLMERMLDRRLRAELPAFNMARFKQWIDEQSADNFGSDVLDTLLSATDFETFKQHMLSYKTEGDLLSLQPSVQSVQSMQSGEFSCK